MAALCVGRNSVHVFFSPLFTLSHPGTNNYLVATGVRYYNPPLVTGVVFGYVPLRNILSCSGNHIEWTVVVVSCTAYFSLFRVQTKQTLIYAGAVINNYCMVHFCIYFFSNNKPSPISDHPFWALPAILPQILVWCRYPLAASQAVARHSDPGDLSLAHGYCGAA